MLIESMFGIMALRLLTVEAVERLPIYEAYDHHRG